MKYIFFCAAMMFQCMLRAEIYDCFTFFNEVELLKVRLEELYDVVDHFVLVEATETFCGDEKPLHFSENAHLFEKYKDKIITVVVDDFPSPSEDAAADRWIREEFQRNAILRGLKNCRKEDIILISDLDEIPSQGAIQNVCLFFQSHGLYPVLSRKRISDAEMLKKENQLICQLNMRLFLFYLNQESPVGWSGAVKAAPYWIVKKRLPWNLKILHMLDRNLPIILNAGWHFHSMGGYERLLQKLEAIYRFDKESFLHPYVIKQISPETAKSGNQVNEEEEWPNPEEISLNPDLFKVWSEAVYGMKLTAIDKSFPRYIRNHVEEFRSLGWIKGAP